MWTSHRPVLVFLDGSFEPEGDFYKAGIGGCLLHPQSGRVLWFGDVVPQDLVRQWLGTAGTQAIAQTELLPALVSLASWSDLLSGCPALFLLTTRAPGQHL